MNMLFLDIRSIVMNLLRRRRGSYADVNVSVNCRSTLRKLSLTEHAPKFRNINDARAFNKLLLFTVVFLVGIGFSIIVQLLPEILRILPGGRPVDVTNFNSFARTNEVPLVKLHAASSVPWQQELLVHDVGIRHGFQYSASDADGHSIGIHTGSQLSLPAASNVQETSADIETEALASLRLAAEMRNNGKDDKAMKLLKHAYALSPKHPDVLNEYGEFIESNEKNLILAEHLYVRALLCSPKHSRALTNRDRLKKSVEEIDELHLERIDGKRDLLITIPDDDASLRRVKKEAYFQHIYHSVGIEGNTMSLAETRHVVETRLAIGGKSVLEHNEILGLDAALAYINTSLVYRVGSLSVSDVLEVHRRVIGFADPLNAGQLRRTQVFVGDHVPPHPSEVSILLSEFVEWLNSREALALHPVRYAALAHYKLVFIHPFTDGNGRTSRLLMNLFLMRAGFPPVIIRKQDRLRYYEYLKAANEGDVRPFIRFIAECTERTLDVYIYATNEYPIRAALEDQTDNIWPRSRTIVV